MKKKRFIKCLMSIGVSRNKANGAARAIQRRKWTYQGWYNILFVSDEDRRMWFMERSEERLDERKTD